MIVDGHGLSQTLAQARRQDAHRLLAALAIGAALAASLAVCGGLDPRRYAGVLATVLQLAIDAVPPDFTRAATWLRPLLETVAMGVAATLLGVAAALPLALLAARPTGLPRPVRMMATTVLNAARSLPELVFGVIFVASVGFGPLAGVLALSCHSVGMLGKFIAEHVEHLDPAPAASLRAQGASRAGIVRYCVLPQLVPRLLDVSLYRWEHNVRAATVMGMVGAGGLGRELVVAFSLFEYREACALLLVIFATVSAIDWISNRLRRAVIQPSPR